MRPSRRSGRPSPASSKPASPSAFVRLSPKACDASPSSNALSLDASDLRRRDLRLRNRAAGSPRRPSGTGDRPGARRDLAASFPVALSVEGTPSPNERSPAPGQVQGRLGDGDASPFPVQAQKPVSPLPAIELARPSDSAPSERVATGAGAEGEDGRCAEAELDPPAAEQTPSASSASAAEQTPEAASAAFQTPSVFASPPAFATSPASPVAIPRGVRAGSPATPVAASPPSDRTAIASAEPSLASLADEAAGPEAEASTDAGSVSVAAEVAGADRRDAAAQKSTLLEKEVVRLRRALANSQRQARDLEARLVEVAFSPQVQEGVSGPQRNESPSRTASPAVEPWDAEVEQHVEPPSGSGRRPRHIPLGARSVSFPAPAGSPARTLARTPSTPVRTSSRSNLPEAGGHRRRGSDSRRHGAAEPFTVDAHVPARAESASDLAGSAAPSAELSATLSPLASRAAASAELAQASADDGALEDAQIKLCFDDGKPGAPPAGAADVGVERAEETSLEAAAA